jgi:class 3 adenylate cyclase
MLATPVFYQNRLYAYAAWYIERTNANLMFPFNRLRLRGQSPRVAFHGDEHSTSTLNFSMKEITDRHPELVRIGESAQGTKTRTSSIIETAETTQINVAIPGIYSNFTIAGSELMRSFAVFRHHMGRRLSLLVAAILICGGVLAFAGAIYFIWPLQELTAATTEIFMGNFKIRIHEDHPDEFAALGKSFNNMAESLEEGMLLKSFVTDSVRREVAGAENSALAEKTETKIATIIFAALCDFASYQKSHAAQEVFNRLQHLLQAADGATRQFGGEIDKMIEDKVMIVFEHPQNESDDIPQRAIKAATFICRQIMAETGMIVAAGINTGVTVAGIMGAEQARLSRTVVGDPVNLAARLAYEAVKTGGGIVISGQIVDAVPEGCIVEKLPINRVKGKTQSIEAFKVLQQEKTNG